MENTKKAWLGVVDFPFPGRASKTREKGITMVIDKGLGLMETKDLLEVGADYIDFLKLGFGTSAFYSENFLRQKLELVHSYSVDIYPGGTFLEVAVWQDQLDCYLDRAKDLGFKTLEVSDGTIKLAAEKRKEIIKKAVDKGFRILTEVGKKDPGEEIKEEERLEQIKEDLENGAWKVIVEGRESGKGIGIYDKNGCIKEESFQKLLNGLRDIEQIIWEAPLKNQQQELILQFGPNVNLGNIQSNEVLSLEALRVGLRGDTLQAALNR